MRSYIITLLIVVFSPNLLAQVKGTVTDVYGNPIAGVSVVLGKSNKGASTDEKGTFVIKNVTDGTYQLNVSSVGYQTIVKNVEVNNGVNSPLLIQLLEDVLMLNGVEIKAKTKTEIVKEKPFSVASISTKGIKNTMVTTNQALANVSGVNIRRTGGLGSNYSFALNGMSGKQIKFFIDDIPLDNSSDALNLENLPVSLVNRIDVFKGVVPVYLGADALGGAVNIVTNQKNKNYFDTSYSLGSFNTHVFSLLGKYHHKKTGFAAKIMSFYNYSDNNYKIDNIDVTDELGNVNGQVNDVERKHDAYNAAMINLQLGVADKSYADELLFGVLFSENRKELQHSYDYQKPFGEAFTKKRLRQFSLTYKNKVLEQLETKIYTSFSNNKINFNDVSPYIYYWIKKRKLRTEHRGELGAKTLSTLDDNAHLINGSATYRLDKKHHFVFNYTKSFMERTGTDEVPKSFIPFKKPHSVDKNIIGVSYNSRFFSKKWNSSLFSKYFNLGIKGRTLNSFTGKVTNVDNSFDKFGYGLATTYRLARKAQFKLSFEKALRLPDGYEVFGDGALTEPNVSLLPESSYNINLGGIYKTTIYDDFNIHFDVNTFYRKSENLIVVLPKIITRVYRNSYDSNIWGLESAFNFNYKNKWFFKSNITNQNISEVVDDELTKIPNIPTFFGNVSLRYLIQDMIKVKDELAFNLSARYVDAFPVYSYTSGNTDRPTIAKQTSQNFNVNYTLDNYNISFSINNLWDAPLYDNFRLQQPGRSYYLKFGYTL